MQVSVETTEGLGRRIRVQVPSERVDSEVESRLKDLRGRVRMNGFRPGKVPLKVVQQRYGEQVRGEVLNEVVQSTYSEALEQEGLRPAAAPEIEPVQTDAGKDLEYQASFEVLPSVEVQGIEEVAVERPAADIGDADIDALIERLRHQQADYSEVDRPADEGDRVTIDFHGTVDGEEFEGNSGEDVPVQLGSGQMPSEFEAELVDVKAGDETRIEYTFPEQFPDETIAGKTATFEVRVKTVEAPDLPEVDDEFAKALGMENGLEELRERVRENLERERDQAVRARVKEQVMDGLLERNPIDLPQVLIDREIEQLREQTKQRMQQYGAEGEEPDLPASQFEDEARRRVALGLLVNEVVRANEIELDRNRLQQALQDIASSYGQPDQVIQAYMQNQQLMESLQVQVMEDQVVDWIAERAQITDKPMSLDVLLGRATDETAGE
ncbi:Trigger factor [wastewater metagenome]|uniref:peptidylprolyl isomerase n=2 Tax=unclassified sequences TaxID=12908 RepID=A0A5B8R7Z9_9ZZZZ|nr:MULTISPECIES: trigger factor [Arhodomonas]MCS4503929.1 trigger factor [Arhodomonas aquaeolei]QEA04856.1 trigger factor [uncultured organism]